MVEPYYEDAWTTIYHGDCREILPVVSPPSSVDLLLADPPYGVAFLLGARLTGNRRTAHGNRRIMRGGKPPVIGDDVPFDPAHLLGYPRLVLFGANHYSDRLPVSGGWIAWDKTGGGRGPDDSFSDVELAWTNVVSTPRVFHHLWKGLVRDSETGEKVLHPTQKPIALMAWIVNNWTHPYDLVVDPYMGSGPVLRAAKNLGRRSIGVELSERYCEIAAKRLGQEVLDFGGAA